MESGAPCPCGSCAPNNWARSVGSGGSTAAGAVEGAADGAARGGGGTGVAPSDSSEESECWGENVEEVALAEEDPARCLAFPCDPCPPRWSTNTAQRKPAVFLAGTVAPAQMFDGVERPAQLFDEAVDPCVETAGGEMRSAEDGAAGGMASTCVGMVSTADGVVAGVVDSAADSGRGGWTRLELIGGGWTRPHWLAERACAMTSASSAVEVSVEVRAQACAPPRPLAGSGVSPSLYLSFSCWESAFHIWPVQRDRMCGYSVII